MRGVRTALSAVALGLAACDGGGSSPAPAAPPTVTPPPPPPPALTVAEAKTIALDLWRDNDLETHPKGSCAACHGPDFVDLAVIGSTADDMRRRALIDGATEREADALVMAVEAMREEYAIPTRDARTFRPFQPGGDVLLPDLADADHIANVKRDIAFGEQVEALLPTLFGPPLETLADAERARAEMLDLLQGTNVEGHNPRGLNLRELPVGMAYPRWSVDLHHGAHEGTFNDWIGDVGFDPRPETRAEWEALSDAYLANPTTGNFWTLYMAVEDLLVPQLLAECTYEGRNAHFACAGAKAFNANKFKSALIGSHMLREGLSPHESTFLRGPIAFSYIEDDPDLAFTLDRKDNNFLPANSWEIGDRARVMLDNDNDAGSFRETLGELGFPEFVQDSIDASATSKAEQQRLRVSWFWIGFTQDPSFARIHASNSTKSGEYMIASLLEENMHLHNAFAAHMRIVAKGTLEEANVRKNKTARPDRVAPVFKLNYSYFVGYYREVAKWKEDKKAGRTIPADLKAEQAEIWSRFSGNAFRMGLHLYLADVADGAEATAVPTDPLKRHFDHYHADHADADYALMNRARAALGEPAFTR